MMRFPTIDRTSETSVRRQIYEQIKDQILSGEMRAGEELPSTRQLASELCVSRSTLVESYEMLLAEGFLKSRQGAKTVVADGIAIQRQTPETVQKPKNVSRPVIADFSTGRPDIAHFPRAQWQKMLLKAAIELPNKELDYTWPQGYAPLREEVACWLSRSRGIAAQADDIFITAGATHALRIVSDLLCPKGGRVIMEDPCHKGLYETLAYGGCEIIPVPVDDWGLRTDGLDEHRHIRMIYVTPSHQFPLGGILPASRRAALIRYALEQDNFIVEDDYDSEFRYSGEPIAPLYSMDPQRVIYIGTFSKTVFPAIRIGFTILPKRIQPLWKRLRMHHDIQNPILEQAAMAEFLRSRAMDRHIRKMKTQYAVKRKLLFGELENQFGGAWSVSGDATGLHVAVRFPEMRFDKAFERRCAEEGIVVSALESHCIAKGAHEDQLLLGYGHMEPDRIAESVRLLHGAIGKLVRSGQVFDTAKNGC
jgi:GntR family transcriptional regulator/MocR family aminotransferase